MDKGAHIKQNPLPAQGPDRCGSCRHCLAYLTIEHKGPISADPELAPRTKLVNPSLDGLAQLEEAEFELLFNGSPVRRAGFLGLRRNLPSRWATVGLAGFFPGWKSGPRPRRRPTRGDPTGARTAAWKSSPIRAIPRARQEHRPRHPTLLELRSSRLMTSRLRRPYSVQLESIHSCVEFNILRMPANEWTCTDGYADSGEEGERASRCREFAAKETAAGGEMREPLRQSSLVTVTAFTNRQRIAALRHWNTRAAVNSWVRGTLICDGGGRPCRYYEPPDQRTRLG